MYAAWDLMLNYITSILDTMCPVKSFNIMNYRPDWMTGDLIEQIKDRDYHVTFMFNVSVKQTRFPDNWKKALVVPIPAQGNLTKVQNFRPISLLPFPGKVLDN